jgi:hypothetical protein
MRGVLGSDGNGKKKEEIERRRGSRGAVMRVW